MSPDPVTPPITPAATKANDALETIAKVVADAAPPVTLSPRFSFKGYSVWTWAAKHQELLKNIGKTETLVLGLGGVANGQVPVITGHVLLVAAIVAAIIPVAMAWDALQYFITQNPA